MRKYIEAFAMVLALFGLFVLGYFCGYVDTMKLSNYTDTPNFHIERSLDENCGCD